MICIINDCITVQNQNHTTHIRNHNNITMHAKCLEMSFVSKYNCELYPHARRMEIMQNENNCNDTIYHKFLAGRLNPFYDLPSLRGEIVHNYNGFRL